MLRLILGKIVISAIVFLQLTQPWIIKINQCFFLYLRMISVKIIKKTCHMDKKKIKNLDTWSLRDTREINSKLRKSKILCVISGRQ